MLVAAAGMAEGQTKRAARPARSSAPKQEPAQLKCPAVLGKGARTTRSYCDVLSGRDPAEGILITIPPHTGPAAVIFDLHNRHTYSEQQVRAGRAFAEYSATVGLLTTKNDLLSRAIVRSSFRTSADLYDRVSGGTGPAGVKAVAPVGVETVRIEVPASVTEVSLLGERLVVERVEGRETFTMPGRPVAIVSNVLVEYRPAPARRTPRKPSPRR